MSCKHTKLPSEFNNRLITPDGDGRGLPVLGRGAFSQEPVLLVTSCEVYLLLSFKKILTMLL
jgi:hypothetical protein